MTKLFDLCVATSVCYLLVQPLFAYASERSLEADINARTEYNDNIFLVDGPHDAVTGVTITPSLSGVIKEANWEANLQAKLRVNKYSDSTIDGNDQLFSLSGQYNAQRNIYSLNVRHDLDSNLRSTSSDFGVVGQRVERKSQSITPRYSRLLSERLVLSLSYTYADVDYEDTGNTGFTPYAAETGSTSLQYDLTQSDQITLSLQATDYRSKNDLQTFKLFTTNIGINHEFSETLSTDFLIGVNRRNSSNLDESSFNFFGQVITRSQVIDFDSRGLVLDAGIVKTMENGSFSIRISRDDTTNSFGGLDQIDSFKFDYVESLSELWRYKVRLTFDDIKSVSDSRAADRDVFIFEARINYSIAPKWSTFASYRYAARRFSSDESENKAPHSNRVFVGLNYSFPSLSTF